MSILMSNQEILDAYSEELDLTYPFSLESLIKSHRRLRKINKENADKTQEQIKLEWEDTRKRIEESINKTEYISIEKLKSMTIQELAIFLN